MKNGTIDEKVSRCQQLVAEIGDELDLFKQSRVNDIARSLSEIQKAKMLVKVGMLTLGDELAINGMRDDENFHALKNNIFDGNIVAAATALNDFKNDHFYSPQSILAITDMVEKSIKSMIRTVGIAENKLGTLGVNEQNLMTQKYGIKFSEEPIAGSIYEINDRYDVSLNLSESSVNKFANLDEVRASLGDVFIKASKEAVSIQAEKVQQSVLPAFSR